MAENLALERHRNNRRVQRTLVQVCSACLILRLGFSVNFMQNVCQECALVLWLCTREAIGPLRDPVTWYGINYAGTQITQWDFQTKESRWTGTSSFVLEVQVRYLCPSII